MREEKLPKSRVLCLIAVIFSVSGGITSVIEIDGAWKTAIVAAVISGGIYLAGTYGRKQKCLAIIGWILGMGLFLRGNREAVENGAVRFGNEILQSINQYYGTDLPVWNPAGRMPQMQTTLLVILLIIGMWENLSFWVKKKRISTVMTIVVPVLILAGGFALGRIRSVWGIFWFLTAVFLGKFLPFQKEKWKSSLAAAGVLLVALMFSLSPMTGQWLKESYKTTHERQMRLENTLIALGEWCEDIFLSEEPKEEVKVNNDKPNQTGEEMFRITVDKKPQSDIYLRGFIGEHYKDGTWKAGDEQEFADWAQAQGFTEYETYQQEIYNHPWEMINGRYDESYNITIHMNKAEAGYTLMPYYASLGADMQVMGDDAVMPCGKTDYTISGVAVSTEKLWKEKSFMEDSWKWTAYAQYVWEHYREYPDTGLERLKEWAEPYNMWPSEEYTEPDNEYGSPYIYEESEIRKLLWKDTQYSQELEPLPEGKDFVEYFLYEQKKGFCVHYATTGTLLLRMIEVPARYVEGYQVKASDFKENSDGTYTAVVTDKQAHAWAEVFSVKTGFYPVEMTPSASLNTETEKPKPNLPEKPETGNQETETVKPETSKPETSKAETSKPQTKKAENEQGWGIPEEILTALIVIVVLEVTVRLILQAAKLRRKHVKKKKYRLFHQKNRSKGAKALGKEICRILKAMGYGRQKGQSERAYGEWLKESKVLEQEVDWQEFILIQQQIAFSEEEISMEQWQKMWELYRKLQEALLLGENKILILYWKYIKILS